jgi:hypothetical protein
VATGAPAAMLPDTGGTGSQMPGTRIGDCPCLADILFPRRDLWDRAAGNQRPALIESKSDDRQADRSGRSEQCQRCGTGTLQQALA